MSTPILIRSLGAMDRALRSIVDRSELSSDAASPSKIPWNDPEFSERMLLEHLDQSHSAASRPFPVIDGHVAWIFHHLLGGTSGSVLDVGCGPGLYTERLARLGCACLGVDFSPASIEYARATASAEGLGCTYRLGDVRTADLGAGHELAMLTFGEINAFSRDDALDLLVRMHDALGEGGRLLLEPHHLAVVQQLGESPSTWSAAHTGLFSAAPHLVLTETAWLASEQTAVVRHLVVDADSAHVETMGERIVGYSDAEYEEMIAAAGFSDIEFHAGYGDFVSRDTFVVTARRDTDAS